MNTTNKKHIAIALELDIDNSYDSSSEYIEKDLRKALTLHTKNWYKILAIVSTGEENDCLAR